MQGGVVSEERMYALHCTSAGQWESTRESAVQRVQGGGDSAVLGTVAAPCRSYS